jgi:hypothetical protein
MAASLKQQPRQLHAPDAGQLQLRQQTGSSKAICTAYSLLALSLLESWQLLQQWHQAALHNDHHPQQQLLLQQQQGMCWTCVSRLMVVLLLMMSHPHMHRLPC